MTLKHFRTRAELERQMDAARQLRAETLAGTGWIFSALAGLWAVIRRIMLRITAYEPHHAQSPRFPWVDGTRRR